MYSSSVILYIRALTPIHIGVGRGEGVHVDLPVQRDEFGYPCIWASSLKGAIKANLNVAKKYLGSEPGIGETVPSSISLLDARLLFMPVRTLENVWTYATTPHLLNYLVNYLSTYAGLQGASALQEVEKLKKQISLGLNRPVSTKIGSAGKSVLVNEAELRDVEVNANLTGVFSNILPRELREVLEEKGLIILPDNGSMGLEILNRSLMIQYRVRLSEKTKTVEAGPWSEEYLPMETVLVSLALCRGYKHDNQEKKAVEVCEDFAREANKVMYVGGRETLGKGLVKIIVHKL